MKILDTETGKFPQKGESLRKQLYTYLRRAITTGELETSKLYSEHEISSTFGISKTPVREALLQLDHEGLIEYHANKGIKVRDIQDDDVRDIFEMRCVLESFVIEALANKNQPKLIEEAENILETQNKCITNNDRAGWISANVNLHMLFVNAFGNKRIADAIERFSNDIQRMGLKLISNRDRMREAFKEHRAIILALKRKDNRAAKRAMIKHLNTTEKLLLELRSDENTQ